MLTDQEKKVLKGRIQEHTLVQQADECDCSTATVSRIISKLQQKYDAVQPYSDLLPVRIKDSPTEKWMDEH